MKSLSMFRPLLSFAQRSLVLSLIVGCVSSAMAQAPQAGPLLSELESRFLSQPRQITADYTRAGEGYFSPDGSQIVFQAVPKDYMFYQIFTQPLEGGTPRLVSTGRGRTTCAYFTLDGKSILFASSHLDPNMDATEAEEKRKLEEDAKSGRRRRYSWDFDKWTEIFVRTPEGELTRLTDSPGYDAEGAFSPDGKKIAFCSDRDGDPDLYIMDADGQNVRQLTNAPGYDGGPFISPDGEWVVFRSDRKQAEFLQIYAIRVDGTCETALTDNVGVNWAPYWHPKRPLIIWTGADHSDPTARPNYDLWIMPYRTNETGIVVGDVTRLTDNPTADVLPVFSPDGEALMWTSNRGPDHASQLWWAKLTLPAELESTLPSP